MTEKVRIAQLDTGVPGFNDVLGGGLPEFSCNLLAGGPGAGKTTLALQMCFALSTPEHPALYITVLGGLPSSSSVINNNSHFSMRPRSTALSALCRLTMRFWKKDWGRSWSGSSQRSRKGIRV